MTTNQIAFYRAKTERDKLEEDKRANRAGEAIKVYDSGLTKRRDYYNYQVGSQQAQAALSQAEAAHRRASTDERNAATNELNARTKLSEAVIDANKAMYDNELKSQQRKESKAREENIKSETENVKEQTKKAKHETVIALHKAKAAPFIETGNAINAMQNIMLRQQDISSNTLEQTSNALGFAGDVLAMIPIGG